jgi:glycosyltransferase involved in cell wall biosynthesis
MISIVILTYNDECQIANCLSSVRALSDDIVVIDSFSNDRTEEICVAAGAKFVQNPFVNQAIQFNWALDNVPLKYDWVLRLDSDEIVPAGLANEMRERVGKDAGVRAYALNRRMIWMGRWLKHGRMYPHYIVRLFQKGYARYEERTEEHLIVTGATARMTNDFLEDNKKNYLDYFTEKHLSTARGELAEALSAPAEAATDELAVDGKLFGTKVERTRWLKEHVYAGTPLFVRPFAYFAYRYFLCLGFLDGVPGLIWHILQGFWYRFYIDAKLWEARKAPYAEPFDYGRI